MTSLRASEIAGDRIKQIRQRRGWTARQLAERCKEIGAREITVSVIANIETGRKDKDGRRRRDVTVDELLAFAYALDIPPVLLMVPLDGADQLQVTPKVEMDVLAAVAWVPGTDGVRDVLGRETAAQRRQDLKPLGLVREIIEALLRAETVRQMRAEVGASAADSSPAIGQEVARLSEWLESLGYTPPPVPEDLAAFIRAEPGGESTGGGED